MRRLILVLFALVSAGCAPAAVGTIDLLPDAPPLRGRLLVVVAPTLGERPAALPDTVRAAEFVPLGALGARSYRSIAADTLVAALRASGVWTDVQVGPLPAGVEFVYGSYRVAAPLVGRRGTMHVRKTLAGLAAPADAFGPNVDAVLIIADAGTGFKTGSTRFMGVPNPTTGMGMTATQADDTIVTRAALVLWNDATGAIVAGATPGGGAPIRSRLFSSAESRSPRGLAHASREAFIEAAADEMPALGLGD
ncbi:MAG TPA: hypothetical protein VF594_05050 [Rubricoccaceae bacterium]